MQKRPKSARFLNSGSSNLGSPFQRLVPGPGSKDPVQSVSFAKCYTKLGSLFSHRVFVPRYGASKTKNLDFWENFSSKKKSEEKIFQKVASEKKNFFFFRPGPKFFLSSRKWTSRNFFLDVIRALENFFIDTDSSPKPLHIVHES